MNSLVEMSDEDVQRVAEVIGPLSAGWTALAEARARRERGENAVIYTSGSTYVVGPRLRPTK